ncbi:MAG: pseudouridine synthase [Bacilli bacterium]
MERLQKVIANSGYCSRRKAEELIINKQVSVNNVIVTRLGTKVNSSDIILIDGQILSEEVKEYYLLYKPRGYITSTADDKHRDIVTDLIETDKRIYPVGRLDYDTTGILLLTNDGEFANMLMHPKNQVDKVYLAKIKGILSGEEIRKLVNGVMIEGVKTAKSKVKVKKIDKKNQTSLVELTIHEGKNHQIKRMFESVNHEIIKLKREKIAFLDLSGLKASEYRKLKIKEVKQLYNYLNNN